MNTTLVPSGDYIQNCRWRILLKKHNLYLLFFLILSKYYNVVIGRNKYLGFIYLKLNTTKQSNNEKSLFELKLKSFPNFHRLDVAPCAIFQWSLFSLVIGIPTSFPNFLKCLLDPEIVEFDRKKELGFKLQTVFSIHRWRFSECNFRVARHVCTK